MLKITIPGMEAYDAERNEFVTVGDKTITLEHSLVSISKWESKWHKAFISNDKKTPEETLDYIRCMTITQNVDPEVYLRIPEDVLKQITDYIDDPMTATTFSDKGSRRSREIITSEIIYYWMIALNIDPKFETWHLNRLLTLIRVCSIKSQKPKKMNRRDQINQQRALNAARRSALHSSG